MKYAFVQEHQSSFPVRRLFKVMEGHPSGYYAWQQVPQSERAIEDPRLLSHVKQSWLESGSIYGYRKVWQDLRELGEGCGVNRIHRLMRKEHLRSQTGYHRRPRTHSGPSSVHAPNHLRLLSPIASGSPTSPISEPMKAGCFWLPCLTCSLGRSLVGRWGRVWTVSCH